MPIIRSIHTHTLLVVVGVDELLDSRKDVHTKQHPRGEGIPVPTAATATTASCVINRPLSHLFLQQNFEFGARQASCSFSSVSISHYGTECTGLAVSARASVYNSVLKSQTSPFSLSLSRGRDRNRSHEAPSFRG